MIAKDTAMPGRDACTPPPSASAPEAAPAHCAVRDGAVQTTESGQLNASCTCVTLDREGLYHALEQAVGDENFCRTLATAQPHLLSGQPMFLSATQAAAMRAAIAAVEAVARMPAYREAVLRNAPALSRQDPGPRGVFMGYDFHLGPAGPQLIEINTNAGGALINGFLLQAQRLCCPSKDTAKDPAEPADAATLCATFLASFISDWQLQRAGEPLRTIAIVDRNPPGQYLYPEFVLFQQMFKTAGLTAVIAAPDELAWRGDALWHGDLRIDLVYNRLTDFAFDEPESAALRAAYLARAVVVTPHPFAHAIFADKRNLALLSNAPALSGIGVDDSLIATLVASIPQTVIVTPDQASELWGQRAHWFFKPAGGYGGKAAYRGDKLTRRVWADILAGDYVAQRVVTPSLRSVMIEGAVQQLKADVRAYTYAGEVQLFAARFYQGQTTNFRTPGGGFAPVFIDRPCAVA